jgi:uncharacterized protein (TIGR03083 family)
MDVATMYAESRDRIISLVSGADPQRLDAPVPATPEWTGKDLVGHLVGIVADVLNGRLDGAGTPAWGDRQAADRKDTPLDDVLDEWRSLADQFDGLLKGAGDNPMLGALGADIVQHELDLRGLLGAPIPDDAAPAIDANLNLMLGFLDRRLKKQGLPGLKLKADSQEWTLGDGEPQATLTAPTVELFRVVAGRRSEAQVRKLDWAGDPTPYLPVLSAFGPLSAHDVEEDFT